MILDVNRTKEILEIFHPYLKWVALVVYGLMFLYVNRIFIKDPILRKWLISSLQETKDGGASGKSLSGFVLVQIIVFSSIAAIIYSPYHVLPEFMFISILTFVGSLYGIKVASKYYDGKTNTTTNYSDTTTTTSSTVTDIKQSDKEPVKEEAKAEEKTKNNPEDLG
jgi:hypothetical protein